MNIDKDWVKRLQDIVEAIAKQAALTLDTGLNKEAQLFAAINHLRGYVESVVIEKND